MCEKEHSRQRAQSGYFSLLVCFLCLFSTVLFMQMTSSCNSNPHCSQTDVPQNQLLTGQLYLSILPNHRLNISQRELKITSQEQVFLCSVFLLIAPSWLQSPRLFTLVFSLIFFLQPKFDSHPFMGFHGGSDSKETVCNAEDLGSISGSGRSPGEGNGNPLSILAWRIPWTEEPGGLQFMGSQRVRHY